MRREGAGPPMSAPTTEEMRQRVAGILVRERQTPELDPDLYRDAVKTTRGLVVAEALLLLLVGFTLDDLSLLRFPGYAIGAVGAVVVLAAGRLWHGRNLARRITVHALEDERDALDAARLRNALFAVAAVLVFVGWLVFFSAGVPPWAL